MDNTPESDGYAYTPLPGESWLHRNWAELEAAHGVSNFEWVVADGDGLIDHSRDLPELIYLVQRAQRETGAVYAYFYYPAPLG